MQTTLDALTSAVGAAWRNTVGRYTIRRPILENDGAVWSDNDFNDLEASLVGSLLRFTPVGQAGRAHYAIVVAGDRAELTLSFSGGIGPSVTMTGQELEEAGLTHCISGVLSGVQRLSGIRRPGSKAHLVTVDGRHATLTPIGAHGGGLKNIAVAIDGGLPRVLPVEDTVQSTNMHWNAWQGQTRDAGTTPKGGGLLPAAAAGAIETDEDSIQGTGEHAELAGEAIRALGVTGASGTCTIRSLADFISALADVRGASNTVSICLAEKRSDTGTRAAATASGEAIMEAARAALAGIRPLIAAMREGGRRHPTWALDCRHRTSGRSHESRAWQQPTVSASVCPVPSPRCSCPAPPVERSRRHPPRGRPRASTYGIGPSRGRARSAWRRAG